MFRTLVRERGEDAPTLADVRRFKAAWEKEASLGVRRGTHTALGTYAAHGRVKDGTRDDMLDALYDAWKIDTDRGLQSLMLASDTATVNELNARARSARSPTGSSPKRGSTSPGP